MTETTQSNHTHASSVKIAPVTFTLQEIDKIIDDIQTEIKTIEFKSKTNDPAPGVIKPLQEIVESLKLKLNQSKRKAYMDVILKPSMLSCFDHMQEHAEATYKALRSKQTRNKTNVTEIPFEHLNLISSDIYFLYQVMEVYKKEYPEINEVLFNKAVADMSNVANKLHGHVHGTCLEVLRNAEVTNDAEFYRVLNMYMTNLKQLLDTFVVMQ